MNRCRHAVGTGPLKDSNGGQNTVKKFAKCALLAFAAVITFEYSYVAAIWMMDGGLAAQEATESVVETHQHLYDSVITALVKIEYDYPVVTDSLKGCFQKPTKPQ